MALKMSETYGTIPPTAPPDYTVATATRPQDDAALVESATAWISNSPTNHNARTPRLEIPVVIPRVDIGGRFSAPFPFMRAYSPELRPYDIDEREFMAFIDNLAVAQAPPAPFQVLDVAGHAVGLVPHHWAMFAGAGMNVAAGVGTVAVSYGRTRYFLEKANREYFAPRGLQVSVCKYQQLTEKLVISPGAAVLADKDPQAGINSIRDRCMCALRPYVAHLSLDVPPPSGERNVLDQIAAKTIERKRRKLVRKQHTKSVDGYSSALSSSSTSSSSSDSSSDDGKAQRKTARRVRKVNRKAKRDLKKHPEEAVRIEEDRTKNIHELEHKPARDTAKGVNKTKKRLSKDLDKVKRLEFILVEALTEQRPVI